MNPGDWRTTPESVLEPVRQFLRIDCDPCWNQWATTDPAICRYVSREDPALDGLANAWTTKSDGCAWVNYPWSEPLKWARKAVWETSLAGESHNILFWGPCYTETLWAKTLYDRCAAVCFWGKRVHHPIPAPILAQVNEERAHDGKKPLGNGSMWPTQMIYLGAFPSRFAKVFSQHGTVMQPHGFSTRTIRP